MAQTTCNICPLPIIILFKSSTSYRRYTVAQLVERWNDDLEIASSSPLYATIFLPTRFARWHTSLQAETHNENDWSVKNQMEYAGVGQYSYI